MIGLGNDIVEIERIKEAIAEHGERFLNRCFTPKEQAYCASHADPAPYFAGRFSAKEAIVKALGSGFGEQVAFLDIEILNNAQGKPEVTFSEKAKNHFGDPKVVLSISHCRSYVTAVAIWCK